MINGALVCKYNSEKGQIDNAWFDSERDATIRSSVKDGDVSSSLTFTGSFSDAKTGKATNFQFVFKADGADKYSIEYFTVADNGAKTSVLAMDLERMQEGKKCAAADRFDDAALMSRVRGSQRANVDDSK